MKKFQSQTLSKYGSHDPYYTLKVLAQIDGFPYQTREKKDSINSSMILLTINKQLDANQFDRSIITQKVSAVSFAIFIFSYTLP